jgi:tetratricopeptide (TPR) repeat protein
MPVNNGASFRHSQYYQRIICDASALYTQGGDSAQKGLDLFDQEWDGIRLGQEQACNSLNDSQDFFKICSLYALDAGILQIRLPPAENIHWQISGLNASRVLKNTRHEAIHLTNLGNAYLLMGDGIRSLSSHQDALNLAVTYHYRDLVGIILGNLGNGYRIIGDMDKAAEYTEKALLINGNKKDIGMNLATLAAVLYNRGNIQAAIEKYQQALTIARERGDLRDEEARLGGMGMCYDALGDWDKGLRIYHEAIDIAERIQDRQGEGYLKGNLGLSLMNLGRLDQAIEVMEDALNIAIEIGDKKGEENRLGNLGSCYYRLKQFEKAESYLTIALDKAREIGDQAGEGVRYGNLALIYKERGLLKESIRYFEEAILIATKTGDDRNQGIYFSNLGSILMEQKDYSHAIQNFESAIKNFQKMGDKRGVSENLGRLALSYLAKKDFSLAKQNADEALLFAEKTEDILFKQKRLAENGKIYGQMGRFLEAIRYFEQALAIATGRLDKLNQANYHANLGQLYLGKGETEKAKLHLKISASLFGELKDSNARLVQDMLDSINQRETKQGIWEKIKRYL